MYKVEIGIDRRWWDDYAVRRPIYWTDSTPHMVIFGNTGSGKTTLLKLILARIGKYVDGASVTCCDYKNELDFLKGTKRYYGYKGMQDGISQFYKDFEARLEGRDSSRDFRVLVLEEFSSFILSLEKKEADRMRSYVSILLNLGRSLGVHVITSFQRPDSAHFQHGARDNLGMVIALSSLSNEAISMFHFCKEEMLDCGTGEGHVLINGLMVPIRIPLVKADVTGWMCKAMS